MSPTDLTLQLGERFKVIKEAILSTYSSLNITLNDKMMAESEVSVTFYQE